MDMQSHVEEFMWIWGCYFRNDPLYRWLPVHVADLFWRHEMLRLTYDGNLIQAEFVLWWGDEADQNIIHFGAHDINHADDMALSVFLMCRSCFHQRVLESSCSYRCEKLISVKTRTIYHIRIALPADPGKLCSRLWLIVENNLWALNWRILSHLCPPVTALPGPI